MYEQISRDYASPRVPHGGQLSWGAPGGTPPPNAGQWLEHLGGQAQAPRVSPPRPGEAEWLGELGGGQPRPLPVGGAQPMPAGPTGQWRGPNKGKPLGPQPPPPSWGGPNAGLLDTIFGRPLPNPQGPSAGFPWGVPLPPMDPGAIFGRPLPPGGTPPPPDLGSLFFGGPPLNPQPGGGLGDYLGWLGQSPFGPQPAPPNFPQGPSMFKQGPGVNAPPLRPPFGPRRIGGGGGGMGR